MSNPIPSALALSTIADNALITAAPHRNNYTAIQTAVNALITALSGGAAGQVLKAVDGTDVVYAGGPPSHQIFTANGTYTSPANVVAIFVECTAGGGGAGGCATGGAGFGGTGSAGGGGAYAAKLIVNPSATYTVTIGAAGSAGAAGNNSGGNGGDTIFGANVVVAKGGTGGPGAAAISSSPLPIGPPALGGPLAGCVGDIIIPGKQGVTGICWNPTNTMQSSVGGDAAGPYGGDGGAVKTTQGGGNAGLQYGAGGSGGVTINGGASVAGGAGFAGLIVVTEFY